jgi:hypothetical protein
MIQVIRLQVGNDWYEEGGAIVPLKANLEKGRYVTGEGVVPFENFAELKAHWEAQQWGYSETAEVFLAEVYTRAEIVELEKQQELFPEQPRADYFCVEDIEIENEEDIVECAETEVMLFKDLAVEGHLYSTPWSKEPNKNYYLNDWALDCEIGTIYSKDFAYFDCNDCNRTICEQDPSNGWNVQYRVIDPEEYERVCTKCYEHHILNFGMNEMICEHKQLSGLFGIQAISQEYGFKIVEPFDNYHIGDAELLIAKAKELDAIGHIIIVQFDRMAIGGIEGYVTMFSKYAPTNEEIFDNGVEIDRYPMQERNM